MAPSVPKYRYCQTDFFTQLFQKNRFFGSRQMLYRSLIRVIFGTIFGTLKKVCRNLHMKPMQIFDTDLKLFAGITDTHQTDKQTRTSYLGTGVAD